MFASLMKSHARLTCVLVVLALAGCANPYSQFYRGTPDARVLPSFVASAQPLRIYSTDDFQRDRLVLMRKGYVQFGASSFQGADGHVTEGQLRKQAETVGAQVVLFSSKYSHTVSGAVPLTLPNTTTSYSQGQATAYGPNGTVNAYGSGTTTTYGSTTTMMPISVSRSDFGAGYFVKTKQHIGLFTEDLADEARRKLGTNAGVHVLTVVEDTSAFRADILPGDFVMAIDDEPVYSASDYLAKVGKAAGKTVRLRINRDGVVSEKAVEGVPY